MDAVKFLKEQYRMCEALKSHCEECGLSYINNKTNLVCADFIKRHPEEAVAIVEKWTKDHPQKTRQSEFLKMFPDARLFDGVLAIDPCKINSSRFDSKECRTYSDEFGVLSCDKCRERFWNEEVDQ